MIRRNVEAWTTVDHMANAFDWVRENTPEDVLHLPGRPPGLVRPRRAAAGRELAGDPLRPAAEWKRRIDELVGGADYFAGPGWHGDLPNLARRVQPAHAPTQIDRIAAAYHASCLVSETPYPFQLCTRTARSTSTRSIRSEPQSARAQSSESERYGSVDSTALPVPDRSRSSP